MRDEAGEGNRVHDEALSPGTWWRVEGENDVSSKGKRIILPGGSSNNSPMHMVS